MARGSKTGGRDFKPGNTFSKGGVPTPPDIKEARKLTRVELERIMTRYLHMSKVELEAESDRKDMTLLEAMVLSVAKKAVIAGDQQRLNFLIEQTLGKLPDKLETTNMNPFANLTDQEKLEKARLAVALLEGKLKKE